VRSRPARRPRRWQAFAGLLAGLWLGLNAEPRRTGIAADSAAIYALLLDELPHAAPIRQPIRLVEVAPANPRYLHDDAAEASRWFSRQLSGLPGAQATRADFERALMDRTPLRGRLPRARVWLLGPGKEGLPRDPLLLLPVHSFSHIGFNPGRTQALVYVSYVCGGTCGDGHYVLLDKSGGRWRITDSAMAWIS
jgi:hypothetical protein